MGYQIDPINARKARQKPAFLIIERIRADPGCKDKRTYSDAAVFIYLAAATPYPPKSVVQLRRLARIFAAAIALSGNAVQIVRKGAGTSTAPSPHFLK
jgi:hypothetical protein